MNFGGPVWHASIADPINRRRADALFAIAEGELDGVGDRAHEWREIGNVGVVHLRRRLTDDEAAPIGPVCDIRGSWEATKRLNAVRRYLPPALRLLPDERLG